MIENEKALIKELRQFYSATTIKHILHPCNFETIHEPDGYADCQNYGGETIIIGLKLDRGGCIIQIGFWTDGCAATIACGSIATELAEGKSVKEAMSIEASDIADALVDLPEGNFHCAEFAARTLRAALKDCLEISREPWKKLYRK